MQWSLVKSWAKENGYTSFREKTNGQANQYDYYWGMEDDPSVTGLATSVSKLAAQIYNHITSDKYIQYQQDFKEALSKEDINHNDLSGQW